MSKKKFALSKEQLALLEIERSRHLKGETKSYSRSEALQIVKGQSAFNSLIF